MIGAGKTQKTLCLLAVLAVLCLAGCGTAKETDERKLQITEPENHLADWKEELPEDDGFGGVSANAIRGMEIQKDGTVVFAVSYEPREEKDTFDYWDISVPYRSMAAVNTEELYDLFGTVAMLGGTKAEGISPEEAGLLDTGTSVFLACVKDQKDGEKGAAKPDLAKTILIGDSDGQGNYYVSMAGSEEIMLVSQLLLDTVLNPEPFQYILKIPALINVDTVSEVRITAGEETHRMEQEENAWMVDQESVTEKEFHTLYGELLDVRITGETEGEAKIPNDQEPVLSLQFYRNLEGASDLEVKYYALDEESLRVSVNGQERFLVQKEDVDAILEKLN